MTNLEGRVLRRRRVRPLAHRVIDDLTLLALLAGRLGRGRSFPADPREVFDELRRACAGAAADYAGISLRRIDAEDGVFWPCPREDHPGTPRLFTDRFAIADGRARFVHTHYRDPAEPPNEQHPHVLTTGRIIRQYQDGERPPRPGRELIWTRPRVSCKVSSHSKGRASASPSRSAAR